MSDKFEFKNEMEKDNSFFLTFRSWDSNPSYSNFPAHDLNFHENKGDGIKSREPSKVFFTLPWVCSLLGKEFRESWISLQLSILPRPKVERQLVPNFGKGTAYPTKYCMQLSEMR